MERGVDADSISASASHTLNLLQQEFDLHAVRARPTLESHEGSRAELEVKLDQMRNRWQ